MVWTFNHNDVGSAAVGRLVILENAINLARISGTDCTAIRVLGDVNEQNFKQVLDQCDALPLYYTYCTTMKAFNNQKPDGTLLRALESTTGRYLMELQDFTEDALLGI